MSVDFIDREARARYTERRRLDLIRCRESLANNDFSELEALGHNLKGNGISFGFPELSRLGEALEASAKNANFHDSSNCLSQLEEWIQDHSLKQ